MTTERHLQDRIDELTRELGGARTFVSILLDKLGGEVHISPSDRASYDPNRVVIMTQSERPYGSVKLAFADRAEQHGPRR